MQVRFVHVVCQPVGAVLDFQRNIQAKFRGMGAKELSEAVFLYLDAAQSANKEDCAVWLSCLQDRHPLVYDYVLTVPLENWALSYRRFPMQSALRTNPVGKCLHE